MFHIYANRTSNSVLSPAADPDFFTSPSCWSTQGQLPESARGENSLTPNSLKSCSVKTFANRKTEITSFQKDSKVGDFANSLLPAECYDIWNHKKF